MAVRILGADRRGGLDTGPGRPGVFGKTAEVRRVAAETLRRRDPRDFIASLIGMVRDHAQIRGQAGRRPRLAGRPFRRGTAVQRPQDLRAYARPDAPDEPEEVAGRVHTGPDLRLLRPLQPVQPGDLGRRRRPVSVGSSIGRPGAAVAAPHLDRGRGPTRHPDRRRPSWQRQAIMNVEPAAARQRRPRDRGLQRRRPRRQRVGSFRSSPTVTGRSESMSRGRLESRGGRDQQGYTYETTARGEADVHAVCRATRRPPPHHSCFAAGTPSAPSKAPGRSSRSGVGDRVLTQDTTTGRLSYVTVLSPPQQARADLQAQSRARNRSSPPASTASGSRVTGG